MLSAVAPQSLPGAALLGGTALAAPGQAWRLAQADDQGADAERPAHRPGTAEAPTDDAAAKAKDAPATPAADALPMRGLAGPYLASRMAAIQNDFPNASDYALRALAQDDTDPFLQDSALVALIVLFHISRYPLGRQRRTKTDQ